MQKLGNNEVTLDENWRHTKSRLRAIMWDLDGTLYDRAAAVAEFAAAQHARFAAVFSAIEVTHFVRRFIELDANGSVWKDIVCRTFLEEAAAKPIFEDGLFRDYVDGFAEHCGLCRRSRKPFAKYEAGDSNWRSSRTDGPTCSAVLSKHSTLILLSMLS